LRIANTDPVGMFSSAAILRPVNPFRLSFATVPMCRSRVRGRPSFAPRSRAAAKPALMRSFDKLLMNSLKRLSYGRCRHSSAGSEQLICNQQVVGSNPTAGSLVNRGSASKDEPLLGHFLDTFSVPEPLKSWPGSAFWVRPPFTGAFRALIGCTTALSHNRAHCHRRVDHSPTARTSNRPRAALTF
jgi:hypothetical protein